MLLSTYKSGRALKRATNLLLIPLPEPQVHAHKFCKVRHLHRKQLIVSSARCVLACNVHTTDCGGNAQPGTVVPERLKKRDQHSCRWRAKLSGANSLVCRSFFVLPPSVVHTSRKGEKRDTHPLPGSLRPCDRASQTADAVRQVVVRISHDARERHLLTCKAQYTSETRKVSRL